MMTTTNEGAKIDGNDGNGDALGDGGGDDGTPDSRSRNGRSGTITVTSSFDSPHRRSCHQAAANAFVGAAGGVSPIGPSRPPPRCDGD